jgi:serine/threonine protein phosphatase PrpC
LAVADGVGGWAESRVDPAIYRKRLCALIEELHATGNVWYIYAPKSSTLVDAVKQNTEIGSCNYVIITLDAHSLVIQTIYLREYGYMILRRESMKDE